VCCIVKHNVGANLPESSPKLLKVTAIFSVPVCDLVLAWTRMCSRHMPNRNQLCLPGEQRTFEHFREARARQSRLPIQSAIQEDLWPAQAAVCAAIEVQRWLTTGRFLLLLIMRHTPRKTGDARRRLHDMPHTCLCRSRFCHRQAWVSTHLPLSIKSQCFDRTIYHHQVSLTTKPAVQHPDNSKGRLVFRR